MRGDRDRIVSQGWAERVTELLPRGRLAVMPGAAHAMGRFRGRELADAARDFLLGEPVSPGA